MNARAEGLLAGIPKEARMIEIGPSYNPLTPKAEGWNSFSIDHMDHAELVKKYAPHPNVDVNRIEEVDFVWYEGALNDAVPQKLHGSFDAFVAGHVIEHTPDLIEFLNAASTLLRPDGQVVLAVPDRRFCFGCFQALTTTGQVLAAHAERRSRHTARLAFDHVAYAVKANGSIAWASIPCDGSS